MRSPKTAILNLVTLQQLVLHDLQRSIAECVAESYQKGQVSSCTGNRAELRTAAHSSNLSDLLTRYSGPSLSSDDGSPPTPSIAADSSTIGDCVRNIIYMNEFASNNYFMTNPFRVRSSRAMERKIMESTGLLKLHGLSDADLEPPYDALRTRLYSIGSRTPGASGGFVLQRLSRFGYAILGGLLVIVPMLVMTNAQNKISFEATTTVSMLIFAILVTYWTDLLPKEVLAATAGYAAVLVVYVGIASPSKA